MTGVAYLQPFLLGLSANQLTKIVEIFPYMSVADTKGASPELSVDLTLPAPLCETVRKLMMIMILSRVTSQKIHQENIQKT